MPLASYIPKFVEDIHAEDEKLKQGEVKDLFLMPGQASERVSLAFIACGRVAVGSTLAKSDPAEFDRYSSLVRRIYTKGGLASNQGCSNSGPV